MILTGYFEYDWDTEREKLINRQIVILNLDRTEFTDTMGITYKFTTQAVDRSGIDALSILVHFLAIMNVAHTSLRTVHYQFVIAVWKPQKRHTREV